jgi:hypothetical protein
MVHQCHTPHQPENIQRMAEPTSCHQNQYTYQSPYYPYPTAVENTYLLPIPPPSPCDLTIRKCTILTPHSNGDPPPVFATTSSETIDFSIGFGFAALIYVSLRISRAFYIDFIDICYKIRVFTHFSLPQLMKCYQNIANPVPYDPNWLGTHTKHLWTFLKMAPILLLMEEMEEFMELIKEVLSLHHSTSLLKKQQQ